MEENAVKTEEVATPETENPTEKIKLWNPNAAINWSLLFTPIFGAWLHSKNWESLGDAESAKKSMYWVYGGFASLALCLFLPEGIDRAPGIILLLAWYFTAGKKQADHVKKNLNNNYERKAWKTPMKFGIIGLVVFFVIAMIASPGIESTLENESVGLVSQILEENLGVGAATCKAVKIDEKVTDGFYKATAVLDNGNDLRITIEYNDDGEIYVQVPFDQ